MSPFVKDLLSTLIMKLQSRVIYINIFNLHTGVSSIAAINVNIKLVIKGLFRDTSRKYTKASRLPVIYVTLKPADKVFSMLT